MTSDPGRRPARRKAWAAAAAVLVLLAGAAGFGAWYGSDQAIGVVRHGSGNTRVLAVQGDLVTLERSARTGKPGTYWLEWSGASSMLGDVVSRTKGGVTRRLLRGQTPSVGTSGYFGNVPAGDPKIAWGIGHSEIMVPTELGPAPAWYVPGEGPVWVVAVHGQNGHRKAELKILPVVHELRLPFLDISYRNDEGAPPSPDGLLHLGDSEWRDLEAALRQAQKMGAKRFVLYGTSMGGQIIGQFLARSPLAAATDRVIMDAPMLDVGITGEQGARNHHLPGFAGTLANKVVEWRTGVDVDRLSLIRHPPKIRPPLLLLHTVPDEEHPIEESRAFVAAAERLGWKVRFEEFAQGEHTEAWNVDRVRYEGLVRGFLSRPWPEAMPPSDRRTARPTSGR
ncbi:alpha/beta hydrolase [Sphaerisporangium siamense]|uniref:Pimeloyl-ACP methyl ester carboxylesterase n=1 Tax=Sphaerisporangium siamense TaxID=795645 RepID=A0A7W7D565_9ACTN|nr:prolyl oligopeptidase family serine peptidase [Sphaerisporangium siamense]MBB4699153.1 pimeloyl-ACP methyl ester carboxylesterase [Sphaerisporangium siamense]GII86720.1 alpha/beta hydrolase [Sphaerisporangium siamense]